MSYVSRDWQCLNRKCGRAFHSYEGANPPCPHCGCVRVSWIPGGGHIAKASPQADRTLRELAGKYGSVKPDGTFIPMRDINSPSHSRLNRAMPKYDHPPADSGRVHTFAPGFSAPFNISAMNYDGRPGRPTCGTSANNVNFKTTVAAEQAMTPVRSSYPQIGRDHWTGIRTRYKP